MLLVNRGIQILDSRRYLLILLLLHRSDVSSDSLNLLRGQVGLGLDYRVGLLLLRFICDVGLTFLFVRR